MFTDSLSYGDQDVSLIVEANSVSAAGAWDEIYIPQWARWVHILLFAGGGAGGNGAVGANSAAAGGGGGGSSGQTSIMIPARLLPDVLFASIGFGGQSPNAAGIPSRISIFPDANTLNCLAFANNGNAGGNAAGATAGAAGGAGAIAAATAMPLVMCGTLNNIAGQAGIIGGVAVAGANLAISTAGLFVSGGAGGGGLPAAAAVGTAGGNVNGSGQVLNAVQATGPATATTPANNGSNGLQDWDLLPFLTTGGGGGSSTHGSPTGAGLVGGLGGHGGYGSGGGGGGGAFTGSTQGLGGRGGNGRAYITFI